MRIERRVTTLIAVLCAVLSAVSALEPDQALEEAEWSSNSSRVRRTPQPHHHPHRHLVQDESTVQNVGAWKRAKWQEMQSILRQEGYTENGSKNVECCPTILEMVEPEGGRNQNGLYVELYRDGENRQRFYEISCRQDVVNQPCRFVDPRLLNQSRCVQQFSFTYALVRDAAAATETPHRHRRGERHFPALPGAGGWSLDYIRVRAGCACEVAPPPRKHKRQERHRSRKIKNKQANEQKRPHDQMEDDET